VRPWLSRVGALFFIQSQHYIFQKWFFSLLQKKIFAVVIFDHGLKFGIIFLVSDHPAHEKLIASKKSFFLSNN
jgi:hypothetical protein